MIMLVIKKKRIKNFINKEIEEVDLKKNIIN